MSSRRTTGAAARSRAAARAAAFALLALLAACQAPRPPAVDVSAPEPASRRSQMLAAEDAARQTATLAWRSQLGRLRDAGQLDADPALAARVRALHARLAAAAAEILPASTAWPWEARVATAVSPDWRGLPGGLLLVSLSADARPLLDDDELAAAMAHEIAHLLRGHPAERAPLRPDALAIAAGVYLRVHDSEADRIGVELAARAGFDPRATMRLWRKLTAQAARGASVPWLAAHPWNEGRERDLPAFVDRSLPLYWKATRGN